MSPITTSSGADCSQAWSTKRLVLKFSATHNIHAAQQALLGWQYRLL
jgi:hypothetical protein